MRGQSFVLSILYLPLKREKISEQQVNPKVLSVANSCHYNENFKNGKHRLNTNARTSGAAPTNPHPPDKSLDAKAPGWGQIFGANPWGCEGGWLWMKLIPT